MKTLLFVIIVFSSGWQLCLSQEISKTDILKTVRHIQALSAQQQVQLAKAQADFEAQGLALQEQTVLANKWHVEASRNAKERDVILIAWGVLVALYVGTFFAGPILREFPTPWNIVGVTLAYLLSGISAFALGRLLVSQLSHLIP